jgi:epsilon-lactone hydrolase
VYTHGGGFVNPLRSGHWHTVRALVEATGATVTVPAYPLAPEHTHEATFRLLEQLHRDLLARVAPERIVHCGDSAGGNLALTQALHFRARGLPLPGHLVLFSPWLDLTMADPEAEALEPRDLMLRVGTLRRWGRWWAGAADPRTPTLSPLYADADALRALPPIQLFVGTDDVLLPDCRTLRDRVAAAGGRLVYDETPHGFHAFMAATFAPEAKRVLRRVAEGLTPGA